MSGVSTVTREDIGRWYDLLVHDQGVIDEVDAKRKELKDEKEKLDQFENEANDRYQFPSAIREKFPSLLLYEGETVGVGEGNRASGSAEQWACLCSLAVQTTVLRAFHAFSDGHHETVDQAKTMLTQYQSRGNTLFGNANPVNALSRDHVITWGRTLQEHADSPEMMFASYLTMVIHDLTKVKSIVKPLAEQFRELNEEALTAKFVESVHLDVDGKYERYTDIKTCDPELRESMKKGFLTGFNASQVMQGESTAVHGLRIAKFLRETGALWFMDHYMLDAAGILGKQHKFIGTLIVDGYTFEPYSAYIRRLIEGRNTDEECETQHKSYHGDRLDMCESAELSDGLARLSKELGVEPTHMQVAFARTIELSRTTTSGSANGLLRCWRDATDRFGPELMSGLVTELNISGLDDQHEVSKEAAFYSVMLEYTPKAFNDAAKDNTWHVEVPILLGLLAVLWRCGRAAAMALYDTGDTRNPFVVTINAIAMRAAPKYAEATGYTWLQWFHEISDAYTDGQPLAPLLEKAVCSKELQLEFSSSS